MHHCAQSWVFDSFLLLRIVNASIDKALAGDKNVHWNTTARACPHDRLLAELPLGNIGPLYNRPNVGTMDQVLEQGWSRWQLRTGQIQELRNRR